MNQRPLLLMLACFVFGEISIYAKEQWIIVAGAVVLLGLLAAYMRANRSYIALLLFVLCIIVGRIRCYSIIKPGILEQEQPTSLAVIVIGQVDKIESASGGNRIYLKNVSYSYQNRYKHSESRDTVTCSTSRQVILWMKETDLKLGQWVRCGGQLTPLPHAANPGGFDSFNYYRGRNVEYQLEVKELTITNKECYELLEYLRCLKERLEGQIKVLLNNPQSGVLTAILLGDKSQLDKGVKKTYQNAGIAHLIAISGLHIGFFGLLLFRLLRLANASYALAAAISGSMLLSYAVMTGYSTSCNRAVVMLLISFLGKVIGRAYDMLSAMSLAGLLLLYMEPLQLVDAGFLLSYGAIVGIGAVYPVLKKGLERLKKRGEKRSEPHKDNKFKHNKDNSKRECVESILLTVGKGVEDSVLLNLSIQLVTIPIILWFYFQLPVYQLMLNLVVLPLMSFLLPVAVLAILLSLFSLPFGQIVMLPAQWILQFFELAGAFTNHLPGAQLVCGQPKPWQVVLYYAALVMVLLSIHFCRWQLALAVLPLLFSCLCSGSSALAITMLDVGQGDGLVIKTPGSHVFLVDGGSSSELKLCEYTYEPYLKSQGITGVDGVVMTHSDEDHISALAELIRQGYPIGNLYLPEILKPDNNYLAFEALARKQHIPITYLSSGDTLDLDGVSFRCLHPKKNRGYENANSYSTTFFLSYGDFSMLFTGDLEKEGEQEVKEELLKRRLSGCTVLKVAHHGSKNSTSEEFLRLVAPRAALISCGKNNRYGHPHQELLNRLCNIGTKIYDTPHCGAICVSVIMKDKNGWLDWLKRKPQKETGEQEIVIKSYIREKW